MIDYILLLFYTGKSQHHSSVLIAFLLLLLSSSPVKIAYVLSRLLCSRLSPLLSSCLLSVPLSLLFRFLPPPLLSMAALIASLFSSSPDSFVLFLISLCQLISSPLPFHFWSGLVSRLLVSSPCISCSLPSSLSPPTSSDRGCSLYSMKFDKKFFYAVVIFSLPQLSTGALELRNCSFRGSRTATFCPFSALWLNEVQFSRILSTIWQQVI